MPIHVIHELLESYKHPICYFKGFSGGLNFKFERTRVLAQNCIDLIVEFYGGDGGTLVWDAQKYGLRSFTHLIPQLQEALPQVEFYAFREESHIRDFSKSWESQCVDSDLFYRVTQEEEQCLRCEETSMEIGATFVVCFGADSSIEEEYLGYLKDIDDLKIVAFDIDRIHNHTTQDCTLTKYGHQDSNLTIIQHQCKAKGKRKKKRRNRGG